MKTHLPGKILILIFVLLLPALHSCTMQKRLYRPGFYMDRHVEKAVNMKTERETEAETEAKTETPATVFGVNSSIAENQPPVKMAGMAVSLVAEYQEVKDGTVKKAPVLKRIAAASKQFHQQFVRKEIRTHVKLTPDQRYTLGVILVIVLLIILAVLGYFNRSIFLKAIFLGLNSLQILLIVGVIVGFIYCIYLLGKCIETACSYF